MGITYYTVGDYNPKIKKGIAAFICVKDNIKIEKFYQKDYINNDKISKNSMELQAILLAIEHIYNNYNNLSPTPIIYSTSTKCVFTINLWIYRWIKDNLVNLNDKTKTTPNLSIISKIYNLKENKKCHFVLNDMSDKQDKIKWIDLMKTKIISF